MKQGQQEQLNTIRTRAKSIVGLIDGFKPYSEDLGDDLLTYIDTDSEQITKNIKELWHSYYTDSD